jgi:hypothetical protein
VADPFGIERVGGFEFVELRGIWVDGFIRRVAQPLIGFEFAGAPSLRFLQGWRFEVRLRDNGNFHLRGFPLDGNGVFRFLPAFDVAADGVLGHRSPVAQILSFRDQPRKRGNRHGVSSVFVGFKKRGVFMDPVPDCSNCNPLRNPVDCRDNGEANDDTTCLADALA